MADNQQTSSPAPRTDRPAATDRPPMERHERSYGGGYGGGYGRDRRSSGDGGEGDDRPDRSGGRGKHKTFFRRKVCKFCVKKAAIDYKDASALRRFTTERGKIMPRRITGTCAKHQRDLAVAIKRARILCLLPYVGK
jgi:small subunit ribosomal protein S18